MRSLILPLLAASLSTPLAASPGTLDFNRAHLVELPASALNNEAQSLAVLDANNDGVDDLAVLRFDQSQAEIVVALGNPRAVYPHYPQAGDNLSLEPFASSVGPFEAPLGSQGLLALDVNFDSLLDLVVVNRANQPVAWLRSGRVFEEIPPIGLQILAPHWLTQLPKSLADLQASRIAESLEHSRASSLPIRLGSHSGGDRISIAENGTVRFVPRAQGAVFTVNSSLNRGDSFDADGFCDTENNPTTDPPTPPSGECTLRAAIEQANFNAGADTIRFAIGGGGPVTIEVGGGAMEILGPLTLDGTTQPGFAGKPLIHLEFSGGGFLPGLSVMSGPSLIRGFIASGFTTEGIAVFEDDVTVETCYLGTNADGTAAEGNFRGLGVAGDNSRIGGAFAGAGNLISGNIAGGVFLGGTNHVFEGNKVGTDVTGAVALGNGLVGAGVLVTGTDSFLVRNLVSGHPSIGIRIDNNGNTVQGNKVGITDSGDVALSNGFAGIYTSGVTSGLIGGVVNPLSSNVVSGNAGDGIRIAASTGVIVVGNLVGTDVTGELPIGNTFNGIHLEASGGVRTSQTTVGGPIFIFGGLGNVVSANGSEGRHGILIEGNSFDNSAEGNLIGLSKSGTLALGNIVDGIRIEEASSNRIGTDASAPSTAPNFIAHNGGAGIAVVDEDDSAGGQDSNANSLTVNVLRDNGGLGIDLTRGTTTLDGPTLNDSGDSDFGPNRLQNYPLLTSVSELSPGVTRIEGTLESNPNLPYDIRIFSNVTCDPSGFGEAETHVGTVRVNTSASGNAAFTFDSSVQVNVLTATATNAENLSTSELSPCTEPEAGGRLGNRVWLDGDDDGLQGITEPGIEGVTVNLLNGAGTAVLATTVTDASGFYGFNGLATDTYRIGVIPPPGLRATGLDQGLDDRIDNDLPPSLITAAFPYTAGSVDLTRDGGLTSLIFADGFEEGLIHWSNVVDGN